MTTCGTGTVLRRWRTVLLALLAGIVADLAVLAVGGTLEVGATPGGLGWAPLVVGEDGR